MSERPAQVERVQAGGELPPWYDLSEWDDSGDTPAAESHSVSLQVCYHTSADRRQPSAPQHTVVG